MSRGGSAGRPVTERSAAAAKGWATRKRLAAARAVRGAEAAIAPGSQADRVLPGHEIAPLIRRTLAALRAREEA